eukprot:TRINITY_DN12572_c0_g1_i1.p1 TRINITY_DN12572_c0_g1~~TRINITY_DN12572_c0_g1_i1.p1  ORF type:complete len:157 (+),score=11.26 TRINITY_DN12572_c0_g1_i1:277-747(+)
MISISGSISLLLENISTWRVEILAYHVVTALILLSSNHRPAMSTPSSRKTHLRADKKKSCLREIVTTCPDAAFVLNEQLWINIRHPYIKEIFGKFPRQVQLSLRRNLGLKQVDRFDLYHIYEGPLHFTQPEIKESQQSFESLLSQFTIENWDLVTL